jgi:hypothetical protein
MHCRPVYMLIYKDTLLSALSGIVRQCSDPHAPARLGDLAAWGSGQNKVPDMFCFGGMEFMEGRYPL